MQNIKKKMSGIPVFKYSMDMIFDMFIHLDEIYNMNRSDYWTRPMWAGKWPTGRYWTLRATGRELDPIPLYRKVLSKSFRTPKTLVIHFLVDYFKFGPFLILFSGLFMHADWTSTKFNKQLPLFN